MMPAPANADLDDAWELCEGAWQAGFGHDVESYAAWMRGQLFEDPADAGGELMIYEEPPRRAPARLASQSAAARFLTLAEASALIRTPAETLRYWIWQGRLTAYKPGRAVLLREADLLALVEAHETRSVRASRAKLHAHARRATMRQR
jgi:excisionase family DNA binding protein